MRLPAAMIACTCGGAEAGAVAVPSGLRTAFSVAAGAAPGAMPPVTGATGWAARGCTTVVPAATCARRTCASARSTRPFTRRWDLRSQERTRRAV